MVAGGREGKGARPPGYGAQVGCTPAGVPEPLSPHCARSVSGTPPGCSRAKLQFPAVVPPLPPNDHRLLSVNPSGWSSGEFVLAQVLRLTPMSFGLISAFRFYFVTKSTGVVWSAGVLSPFRIFSAASMPKTAR